MSQLTPEQVNRYKRHLILPEVGMEGQKKLLDAKVLVIGAGGLGCPISLYLAAAGVGTIGLADVDVVSPSNLQRQVLFGNAVIGEPKVEAAAKRLKDLNPDLKVIPHKVIVNSENVMDLLESLHKEGATICMVTHDPRFARYAQRTIHLFDGRVVEEEQGIQRELSSRKLEEIE